MARSLCLIALAVTSIGLLAGDAQAEGTLFRWRSDSPAGGPDLSEPIVTDRPDFTEASVTVGKGVLQIESGYTFIHNDDGGVRNQTHSLGEVLFRCGILHDWLELRLAVFPLVTETSTAGATDRSYGVDDLYLGVKFALTGQDGLLPEVAFVPQVFVPAGSSEFSSDRVLPGANLLYGWDITETVGTGGSTQFNQSLDGGTGGEFTLLAQSWTVNYSLTDQLGAYTEWFALIPSGADTERAQHYFDGGFTYLLTDNVQWDIRAGVGLNGAADDYFVGTGLSVRFK